jgi:hypothetical protein
MARTRLSIRVDLIEGGRSAPEWDDVPDESQPSTGVRLSSLELGEQFLYTFDLGDDWTPPVHRRPRPDRPCRGSRDPSGASASLLGLGHDSGSVRP